MNYANHYKNYSGKNVLITGGLGFIGSNLAIKLVELGAKVTILDSMIDAYGGNFFNIDPIKEKAHINISDVRDKYGIQHLVKDQSVIFNLAGQVSHIDSMTDPETDLNINCVSQLALLQAVQKHNPKARIVFASTRQIYGRPKYVPVNEEHPINPTDINGINKTAGEWYHKLYHEVHGLDTVSLRLTNTFGPRQLMKHNKQGFIPWFIRLLIEGKTIQLFGTGEQIRDINFVDDAVDAFLLAGIHENAKGKVYNLGGEPISLLNLVKKMIEVNKAGEYTLVPFPEEKKKIDIGDFYGDYSKIKNELGWEPCVTLADALTKTFDYYRENRQHYW